MTLRLDDVPIFISLMSRHCWDLINEIFRYKIENKKNDEGLERRAIDEKTTQVRIERSCSSLYLYLFSQVFNDYKLYGCIGH